MTASPRQGLAATIKLAGTKVGVGNSLRKLRKHHRAMRRLPGAWEPEYLLEDLAPAFADHTPGK